MDKTICELFAGVGGFRLGLERADKNWTTVWANQWEPGRKSQHAFDCYCSHFGNYDYYINEDIASVDKTAIPDHNLLVGGFPCQDYSVARTGAAGMKGQKGALWWEIRDILEKKSPGFVLLENVDRLLKSPASQKGRDFGIMLTCFHALHYHVEWRVINAAEYGFSQRRRRVFIFAYKDTTNYAKYIKKFINHPECIFNNTGFFSHSFPTLGISCDAIHDIELAETDLTKVTKQFSYEFGNSGFMYNGKVYTCHTSPVCEEPIPLKDLLDKGVDSHFTLGIILRNGNI